MDQGTGGRPGGSDAAGGLNLGFPDLPPPAPTHLGPMWVYLPSLSSIFLTRFSNSTRRSSRRSNLDLPASLCLTHVAK